MPRDDGDDRGSIRNVERATQYRDYRGLRWGAITPSDIDGVLDFQGRLFVLIELKLAGAKFEWGQRLMYRNLHSAISRRATCVVLVAEHHVYDPKEAIDAAKADVVEILDGPRWRPPMRPVTLREAIDAYHRRAFPEVA